MGVFREYDATRRSICLVVVNYISNINYLEEEQFSPLTFPECECKLLSDADQIALRL